MRITVEIERDEVIAANSALALAGDIETLCYNLDSQGIPPATVKVLHRAYRVLKPICDMYFGEDCPLLWEAPSYKFQPKAKAKC
jgi:hypothetical protein